jgi:phospholipase C
MRPDSSRALILAIALLALAPLCACRGGIGPAPQSMLPYSGARPLLNAASKIKHVVIIVQENRSFNNLFMGYPGAKTQSYGYDTAGNKIALQAVSLATKWDLAHDAEGFYAACNGKGKIPGTDCQMNGFDKEKVTCGPGYKYKCPNDHPQYIYADPSETAPYFSMAKQYVLADEMYASNFDASSYVSHQYIIAGQAPGTAQGTLQYNYPAANWGCPGGHADSVPTIDVSPPRKFAGYINPVCFDYKTLGDELDDAKLSWSFYAASLGKHAGKECGSGAGDDSGTKSGSYVETGIWSSYQAIKHICYGPDWKKDVVTPPTQFLKDVAAGSLRDVTWITPYCRDSDHPGCDSDTGPSWVTSLVNAVGESSFWKSTAIFVFWDDYGGLYDSQPPQYLTDDPDGLGIRIPLLIISPYAKKGVVSHTHYEHGSILKFIEQRFGLAALAASDKRAHSVLDCFDFSQSPRKFVPIQSKYNMSHFLHEPVDFRPPDTN